MSNIASGCAGSAARTDHADKPLREAATVIVVRARQRADHHPFEILLVRRRHTMAFMANAFVFPGGAVDKSDADAPHAAVRELREEAGLVLPPSSLHPFSHWITPSVEPKRFSAHFYVALIADGQAITLDENEITEAQWMAPSEALSRREALLLPPPQQLTCFQLTQYGSLAALAGHAVFPSPILPRFGQTDAGAAILLPWDEHYESHGQGQAAVWPVGASSTMRDMRYPSRFVQNERGYFSMLER